MKNRKNILLSLLYPRTCCFCGTIEERGICDACREKLVYVKEPRCKKCGKPIRQEEKEYCYDCSHRDFAFEQGKSVWLHKEPVSSSIYQFKYHNKRIYADFYAEEMFRLYGSWIKKNGIEVIIPVPLHKKRRRRRGYNQAEILAKHLAEKSGIPMNAKAVVREKKTVPQKALNEKQRKKNLENAFAVTQRWQGEKRVLLIDDIYTTGSTMDALAKELKKKGVEKVWFLTISIGQGF